MEPLHLQGDSKGLETEEPSPKQILQQCLSPSLTESSKFS